MDFLTLAGKRQSDRAYQDQPVKREDILTCLEAARLAPSACNSQPWKFVVVDEPALRAQVAAAIANNPAGINKFAETAPVFVAVVEEQAKLFNDKIPSDTWAYYDLGAATEHFCLQAAELGLGTCIMGAFDNDKVKELLQIPAERKLRVIVALGYPSSDVLRTKMRKEIKDIASFNGYQTNEA
ncbi:MAG: nitroreductase family protein [Peptococcaceae bacterium]|nr:nitroreductase family protein [Peptococcaceae bacterium]